jgi:hypothetical protein
MDDIDVVLVDLADTVAQLSDLAARHDLLIARARHAGASWAAVAAALGVSVQAVHKRYRNVRHDPATGRVWHEPPLPM